MFKLGIYPKNDRDRSSRRFTTKVRDFLDRNRKPLTLLRPDSPAKPAQIALFESVMRRVALSSGVYRTTYRGRFREFDLFINQLIKIHFPLSTPLHVQDWAASDCLTSADWARLVFALYPEATFTASDLTMFLIEARLPGGETLILETGGELLQYIRPPFVVGLYPPEPSFLIVSRMLAKQGLEKARRLTAGWHLPESWLTLDGPAEHREGDVVCARIPLVHPEAMDLHRASGQFKIQKHSVFEPALSEAHVIRTMNIFNTGYFPKTQILAGIQAVFQSLLPGGLWIVGRTYQEKPPLHNATIFERVTDGFRVVDRFGTGSEIEAIVLEAYGR